jgi:hypothetical protein
MSDNNKTKSTSNSDFLLYFILFPFGAAMIQRTFETGIWLFFVAWLALCLVYNFAKTEDKKDTEQGN